jgi:heat shock protein HtpX
MLATIMLLSVLTAIFLVVGWAIAGVLGSIIALFMAIVINFISYWYSDKIVLKMYRAEKLENEKLEKILENLAKNAKIAKPELYLIKEKIPNAFATGRGPKKSAIAVTSGLLELDDEEIEGVLAHEIAHIKNRDVLISTVAAAIGGAVSFLAQMGYWMLFLNGERRSEMNILGLLAIIIFAPLAAFFVRMAISRNREYKADYSGAILCKKPKALASALKKISAHTEKAYIKGPSATSHLWIVNPFKQDWFNSLFSSHPPIQKRIEILEEMEIV